MRERTVDPDAVTEATTGAEVPAAPIDGASAGPVRRTAYPGAGGPALLVGWALLVAVFFFSGLRSLLAPTLDLAATLGLALLSTYSFWFLGWRLRRRFLRLRDSGLDSLEESLVELAVGIGSVALAMFLVGSLGLYSAPAAWCVVALPLAGNQLAFLRELRRRVAAVTRTTGFSLASLLLLLVGLMTAVQSLAPATSQDALVYHLSVPAKFIEEGGLHYVEGNFFSAFPQNVEMLFTLGLLLDGESLAKWYHWLLGACATLAVAALARRIARGDGRSSSGEPRASLAAALFATIPTVALIAGWAYVDLGVVFFMTLSTLLLVIFAGRQRGLAGSWIRHDSTACLVTASIAAGLAAGCKYTAGVQGILVAVLVVYLGVRAGRGWRPILGQVTLVSTVVLLSAGPWFLKNLITTGNPLFPFAYSIFGGADWDRERATVLAMSLAEWGGMRTGWELLTIPWDVSVSGDFFSQEKFDGVIGCAFLIGAPLLLRGLRLSAAYRLGFLVFLLHGFFWVLTTQQIRFLLPALAVASALLAVAVGSLQRGWRRSVPELLVGACLVCNVVIIAIHFAGHNPLPVVLGHEDVHRYLAREVPGGDYDVFRHIDERLPEDSRILFGSCGNPGYLCKRPYRSDALFENFTLVKHLEEAGDVEGLRGIFERHGYSHLLFRLDCVFDPSGRKSEIPPEGQYLLARYLERYGRPEIRKGLTVLYALKTREPAGGDGDAGEPGGTVREDEP